MRFGLALLAACGGGPEVPPVPPQALVLSAPVREGIPPWRLQILVPGEQADTLSPEVLFPALIAAIEPALTSCGITAAHGTTFLVEGELRLEPGFPGNGGGPLAIHVADATDDVRCVVDAANAVGVAGPEGVSLRAPLAIVLRDDVEWTPLPTIDPLPPGDAPPAGAGPGASSD